MSGATLTNIENRVLQLEANIHGLSLQYNQVLDKRLYDFVTREEYRALNSRLTSATSLNGSLIDQVITQLEANTLLTLTPEEAEALKAGAQKAASVQADFKRVVAEIQTDIDTFQKILTGSGRSLETRLETIESTVGINTAQLEILEAAYGTVVASVNEVKRNIDKAPYLWIQNATPIDAKTGDIWINNVGDIRYLLWNGVWSNDTSHLDADVDALQSAVTVLQAAVLASQNNITTLQSQMTTAQSDINTLESNMSAAQSDISTLESTMTIAVADLDALEVTVTGVQVNVADASSQIVAASSMFISHNHDGSNSTKVLGTNIDSTAAPASGYVITSKGDGTSIWASSVAGGGGSTNTFEQEISLNAYEAAGDSLEVTAEAVLDVKKNTTGDTYVRSDGTVDISYDESVEATTITITNLLNATIAYKVTFLE